MKNKVEETKKWITKTGNFKNQIEIKRYKKN